MGLRDAHGEDPPFGGLRPSTGDARGELRALLRWAHTPGVGPRRLREAVDLVGSAEALVDHERAAHLLGMPSVDVADGELADRVLEACRRYEVRPVGWHQPDYPGGLLHLDDPPPVLFVRGARVPHLETGVAVVGARNASGYGRRVARTLARELGSRGVPVLSGMALGVDGEAHAGALEGGTYTLAVLGGGVERARPASHRRLYRQILRAGGSIVGEWAPGTPARAFHFPRRNRILAALSKVVVVVEAGVKSGALSTAAHARRLGREVTAVPGPIDRPGHRGANMLIRDGCAPILEAQDVLDRVGAVGALLPSASAAQAVPLGDPSSRQVAEALAAGPTTLEGLIGRLSLPTPTILQALTRLEIGGRIEREAGGILRGRPG